ncbi:hypothetical protein TBH_C0238 [Thiolapillus brandeum]|uniref:Uncharacterized protein n=1 Tax=Thiolapillus brandeum TaxID=1076588 RepID=A0A7U6GGK0_9GAMM|nr:hypothetical protein TBH_C0238 [Thiolapillus brandeum]
MGLGLSHKSSKLQRRLNHCFRKLSRYFSVDWLTHHRRPAFMLCRWRGDEDSAPFLLPDGLRVWPFIYSICFSLIILFARKDCGFEWSLVFWSILPFAILGWVIPLFLYHRCDRQSRRTPTTRHRLTVLAAVWKTWPRHLDSFSKLPTEVYPAPTGCGKSDHEQCKHFAELHRYYWCRLECYWSKVMGLVKACLPQICSDDVDRDPRYWRLSGSVYQSFATSGLNEFFQSDGRLLWYNRGVLRWLKYWCSPLWSSWLYLVAYSFLSVSTNEWKYMVKMWMLISVIFVWRQTSLFHHQAFFHKELYKRIPAVRGRAVTQVGLDRSIPRLQLGLLISVLVSGGFLFLGK